MDKGGNGMGKRVFTVILILIIISGLIVTTIKTNETDVDHNVHANSDMGEQIAVGLEKTG